MLGLKPEGIEIIHPCMLLHSTAAKEDNKYVPQKNDEEGAAVGKELIPWSDHSGLLSTFRLIDA